MRERAPPRPRRPLTRLAPQWEQPTSARPPPGRPQLRPVQQMHQGLARQQQEPLLKIQPRAQLPMNVKPPALNR